MGVGIDTWRRRSGGGRPKDPMACFQTKGPIKSDILAFDTSFFTTGIGTAIICLLVVVTSRPIPLACQVDSDEAAPLDHAACLRSNAPVEMYEPLVEAERLREPGATVPIAAVAALLHDTNVRATLVVVCAGAVIFRMVGLTKAPDLGLVQRHIGELVSIFTEYAKAGVAGSGSAKAAAAMQQLELTNLALDSDLATEAFQTICTHIIKSDRRKLEGKGAEAAQPATMEDAWEPFLPLLWAKAPESKRNDDAAKMLSKIKDSIFASPAPCNRRLPRLTTAAIAATEAPAPLRAGPKTAACRMRGGGCGGSKPAEPPVEAQDVAVTVESSAQEGLFKLMVIRDDQTRPDEMKLISALSGLEGLKITTDVETCESLYVVMLMTHGWQTSTQCQTVANRAYHRCTALRLDITLIPIEYDQFDRTYDAIHDQDWLSKLRKLRTTNRGNPGDDSWMEEVKMYLPMHGHRGYSSIDFPGRCVPTQSFFISSFPGIYEDFWNMMTKDLSPPQNLVTNQLSVSCVFFPETSELFGTHATGPWLHTKGWGCLCAQLYGGKQNGGLTDKPDPKYHTWPLGEDGIRKAPFGCGWGEKWLHETMKCLNAGQEPIVLYKRGRCGVNTSKGLGFSQLGEVRLLTLMLKQRGIKKSFTGYDISEFPRLAMCAHEKRDHIDYALELLLIGVAINSELEAALTKTIAKLIGHRLPVAKLSGHRLPVKLLSEGSEVRVRWVVRDAAVLPEVRSAIFDLSRGFARELKRRVPQVMVKHDLRCFGEQYELLNSRFHQLTKHQAGVLRQIKKHADARVEAFAGTGKTHLGMHWMLQHLLSGFLDGLLYVASAKPRALMLLKWLYLGLTHKGKTDEQASQLLSDRVHILFPPLSDASLCQCRIADPSRESSKPEGDRYPECKDHAAQYPGCKVILLTPVASAAGPRLARKYGLIVVDEAHRVYADADDGKFVSAYRFDHRLLLCDASQSASHTVSYPKVSQQAVASLTEVVRTSERIWLAASAFQSSQQAPQSSAHGLSGPPLKTFLFDAVGSGKQRYRQYALEVKKALDQLRDEASGMLLHDRVAVIVPDGDFREKLLAALLLEVDGPYRFITAVEASAIIGDTGIGIQSIVLDGVDEFDGLERLAVIAVGLDAIINKSGDASSTLKARSGIFRALTRAYMVAVVVNEVVPGGWLEFLLKTKFDDSSKFDCAKDKEHVNLGMARSIVQGTERAPSKPAEAAWPATEMAAVQSMPSGSMGRAAATSTAAAALAPAQPALPQVAQTLWDTGSNSSSHRVTSLDFDPISDPISKLPAFVADDARVVLSEGGRRVTGKKEVDHWTAVTTAVLGTGRTSVEFLLVKKSDYGAPVGVLKEGAERGNFLGLQRGGVGLLPGGVLRVDGDIKRDDLPKFKAGDRLRLEHDGAAGALLFFINGREVLQWPGHFVSHSVAVGGCFDGVTWDLVKPSVP